jgi:hypothetical protein
VVLVHGEPPAQRVLKEKLSERGAKAVAVPKSGDILAV